MAVIVMDVVLQFLEGAAHQHGTARVAEGLTAEPPSADRICSARLVKEKLSTSPLSASPISRWMRPSVDEVNCSGTSRMLFSPPQPAPGCAGTAGWSFRCRSRLKVVLTW